MTDLFTVAPLTDVMRAALADTFTVHHVTDMEDPVAWLEKVYDKLGLEGFEDAVPLFRHHLETQRNFKKNEYEYPQEVVETVRKHWSFALEMMGYEQVAEHSNS